jgi:hypothetical protein
VDDVLVNFDFANPDMPNGKRHDTTVPQQALFFMNSPLVIEQAKRLVAQADFKSCKDDAARIQFLYERIYQRLPKPEETSIGLEFVAQSTTPKAVVASADEVQPVSNRGKKFGPKQMAKQRFERNRTGDSSPREPLTAWEEYAHALLQANEASFVN